METPFKTKGGRSLFLDKLLLVRTGLKYIYLEYRFFTVSRMVHWYKAHREVLDGDRIHLRRADGWVSIKLKASA